MPSEASELRKAEQPPSTRTTVTLGMKYTTEREFERARRSLKTAAMVSDLCDGWCRRTVLKNRACGLTLIQVGVGKRQ